MIGYKTVKMALFCPLGITGCVPQENGKNPLLTELVLLRLLDISFLFFSSFSYLNLTLDQKRVETTWGNNLYFNTLFQMWLLLFLFPLLVSCPITGITTRSLRITFLLKGQPHDPSNQCELSIRLTYCHAQLA